ncbi:MAG: hypothetical protein OEV92_12980 [Nitrospinota bacterium]|nr:hypothetical protein [Nitrospinota bacterium]
MISVPRLAVGFAIAAVCLFMAPSAWALPSYARDSKASCLSCHYKSSTGLSINSALRKGQQVSVALPKDKIKAGIRFYPAPEKSKNNAPISKTLAGFSGYVGSDLITASLGWADPSAGRLIPTEDGKNDELWYRLAVTPSALGVNFSFGLFGAGEYQGDNIQSPIRIRMGRGLGAITLPFSLDTMGLDAGFSGSVAGLTLDLQTMYFTPGGVDGGLASFMQGRPGGFSAKAQLGVDEDFGFSAAYSTYMLSSGGDKPMPEKSATIGAWFKVKDNIKIMPEYTIYGPDQKWLDKGAGEFYLRFFTGF